MPQSTLEYIATVKVAACPICSGELASLGISEDYTIHALRGRVTVDFVMCRACRFVTAGHVLPPDTLKRYYQESPKLREPVASVSGRALYAAQAAFMARAGTLNAARVLDIGADMGKLLDHLNAEYRCATYYDEENLTAKAWLQQSRRHADVDTLSTPPAFDWIVLSEVLEHIVGPVAMLAGLRHLLTADGKIFIEVPHHGVWDDSDVGLFFEHVNYFSPESLTAAIVRAGYHLLSLDVTTDGHYLEGRCRIIRACIQTRAQSAIDDALDVVRKHDRRQKLARLEAVEALSRRLSGRGFGGLALYGAAETADLVLRHLDAVGSYVVAVFDSDVRKHGTLVWGHRVRPPTEIVSVNPGTIVILSSAEADIRTIIAAGGYDGDVIGWSEIVAP